MVDVAIIGAGPAGLTSAIYLLRGNKEVLLFDKGIPGGQMINTSSIDNYPGAVGFDGPTLAQTMYKQVKDLGLKVKREEVTLLVKRDNYFIVKTNKGEYEAKNVILALGLKNRMLGFSNESEFLGRGISFCAICDGALYKGMSVAVVGGGNSAVEEAIYLSSIVSEVHLIHRRDEFRCDKSLVDKMKEKANIKLHLCEEIERIESDNDGKVASIVLKSGTKIGAKALFEFVGQIPVTSFLKDSNLDVLNERGFITVNNDYETSVKGLYAIGDCIEKEIRQVATSVGDGACCASIINRKI